MMACQATSGPSLTASHWLVALVLTMSFLATVIAERPTIDPILIDCGSTNHSLVDGQAWQADNYYLAGTAHSLATNQTSLRVPDSNLRAFAAGEVSCYVVPAPDGKYLVRMSFAYRNFDGRNMPPSFDVYIEGILVESVNVGERESSQDGGGAFYTGFIVYVLDGDCDVCLYPLQGETTFVNTLQLYPLDEAAYTADVLDRTVFLANYKRVNSGGPKVRASEDPGYRIWKADEREVRGAAEAGKSRVLTSGGNAIVGAEVAPDYFPRQIFETAREAGAGNFTGYDWRLPSVSILHRWMVRMYFAELNPAVRVGERVFDLHVNDVFLRGFDILAESGGRHLAPVHATLFFNFSLPTYTNPYNVHVGVTSAPGSKYPPLLCAVEVYEIIPTYATREDVEAGVNETGRGVCVTVRMCTVGTWHGCELTVPEHERDCKTDYSVSFRRRATGLSGGQVAAIAISGSSALCLVAVVGLLGAMWRRQRRAADGGPEGDGLPFARPPAPANERAPSSSDRETPSSSIGGRGRAFPQLDREAAFLEHRYGGMIPDQPLPSSSTASLYERGESSRAMLMHI
eukprot:jgi/Mesen1/7770/ME000408S06879